MPMHHIRAMAVLSQAVELGSLRRAAAAQGISPQAASQALVQLETHLGVRLLHRTTRSLALTEEGQQLLETAQPAMAALERALNRARSAKDDVAGPLRIVGPQSSFAPVLWSVLDEYCQRHPEVQPDIQLDDRIGNWVEDRVDVGFRVGVSPQEGLVARRLLPMQILTCAAPAYLARYGAPASLEALASHRCSLYRHAGSGRLLPWFFRQGDAIITRELPPTLSVNDAAVELEAVLSGQVIAQLASSQVTQAVRQGRLVPLFTEQMADHMSLFIYWGSRRTQPSRVRAFIDLAVARLADNPALFLSHAELADAEARGRAAVA
ncbi:LysR family transcriptional regulator [Ideonella livida]|uniref:LysR family transcriptional regulator n=1 Tax=Ideonella livida TaxID=2707176 RepID=A0A7C9TLE8_9BURK|nr:LysR family transcriptional regulator [Ideonella livida]NDY93138.1 LysR family transcriptional regulator [Ideonella livida]